MSMTEDDLDASFGRWTKELWAACILYHLRGKKMTINGMDCGRFHPDTLKSLTPWTSIVNVRATACGASQDALKALRRMHPGLSKETESMNVHVDGMEIGSISGEYGATEDRKLFISVNPEHLSFLAEEAYVRWCVGACPSPADADFLYVGNWANSLIYVDFNQRHP